MRGLQILALVSFILLLARCGSTPVNPWTPYQHDDRVIFPHGNSLPNVSLCEEWINPIPGLDAAMEGHDPFLADPLSLHDPGVKQKIFEPLRYLPNGRVALQLFIGRAREQQICNKDFTSTTVKSYADYKIKTSSSQKVAHNGDSKVEAAIHGFTVKASTGGGRGTTEEEKNIISFFNETSGEIIVSTTECITHSVAIAPFHEPIFTAAFKKALKALASATNNSNSSERNLAAKKFLENYGTHYLKETQLGAKLVIIESFSRRSMNARQERERQQCARRSANAGVGRGYGGIASAENNYSHESDKCQESAQNGRAGGDSTSRSVRVRSIGTFPSNTSEMSTLTSPAPISFRKEIITSLIRTEWLEANSLGEINATELAHFLGEKIHWYCQTMYNEPCDIESNPCAYNGHECPARHTCEEDNTAATGYSCIPRFGAVIISGGVTWNDNPKSVEVLGGPQLPELPSEMFSPTLTAVGDLLYSCGRDEEKVKQAICYKMDTSASGPRWFRTTRPSAAMGGHTAVAVGTHIWFVYKNELHDLDTGRELFRTYDLPFTVTFYHCAVSNRTSSYLIGVGADNRDIWVGSSPTTWQKVGRLRSGREGHACLWLGSEVYITGGGGTTANVEVLNTRTHQVSAKASLRTARKGHAMMVLNGEPAVVGGLVESTTELKFTDTIESYDIKKGEWKRSNRKLKGFRALFGLAQLFVRDK